MVTMDNKGQISVEFILFVGFILAIILVIGVYAGDQNEQNNIATATRLGAVNATTSMGITNPGMLPVSVNSVQMSGTGNITLIINLSYTSTQIQNTTLTGVYNALTSQGYAPQKNSIGYNIQNLTFNTSRHNYAISVSS
jgi:uncharacterized protein (UPF0333 family)